LGEDHAPGPSFRQHCRPPGMGLPGNLSCNRICIASNPRQTEEQVRTRNGINEILSGLKVGVRRAKNRACNAKVRYLDPIMR